MIEVVGLVCICSQKAEKRSRIEAGRPASPEARPTQPFILKILYQVPVLNGMIHQ